MIRLAPAQLNGLLALALLSIAAMRPGLPIDSVRVDAVYGGPMTVAPVELEAVPFHPEPVMLGDSRGYTPPDFRQYRDVAEKKRAFFEYLLPMVHEANEEVARERAWLEALAEAMVHGRVPTPAELGELALIEERYAVQPRQATPVERVAELLERVDVVPASLVMAQAAKESGWGTSRFAREGNNYFGIWCFYEGCGMTPRRRAPGRTHEVATFDSVEEGVRYYIRTINTHIAYAGLRDMRAEARRRNQMLPGAVLAGGLERYSERGLAYVREIQSMIHYNGLSRFTRPYSA